MGLAERRAAKNFETNQLPALQKEIDAAAGFSIPLEINWEQLSPEGQTHLYEESWTKVYFRPLIDALKAICVDDMGKAALKGALKKVVIKNAQNVYYGDRIATFEGGVLTLDHEPTTNIDDVADRAKGIQATLEKNL